MKPTDTPHADSSPPDTAALLQRILVAVEQDTGRGVLELSLAIILSLATLASTWCGYQSRRWGTLQSNRQATADTDERQSSEDAILGLQIRTYDGIILIQYWAAVRQGEKPTAEALLAHTRPVLRKAIEASLADGALQNPKAIGPLQRPEYVLAEEQEAARLKAHAAEARDIARLAGQYSDHYVSLTLSFASVLFFGGITGTFSHRRVKQGLAGVALLLFLGTIAFLFGLPVCRG